MFGIKTNSPDMFSVSPTPSESESDSDSLNVSARSLDSTAGSITSRDSTPPLPIAAIVAPVVIRPIPIKTPAIAPATVSTSPQSIANENSANGSPVSTTGSPIADHKTLSAAAKHMFFQPIVDEEKSSSVNAIDLRTQLCDDIKMCDFLIKENYGFSRGILLSFSTEEIAVFLNKHKIRLNIDDAKLHQLTQNLDVLNRTSQPYRNFQKQIGYQWYTKYCESAITMTDYSKYQEVLNQYCEEFALLKDEELSLTAPSATFMMLLNDKRAQIERLKIKMEKMVGVHLEYQSNYTDAAFLSVDNARNINIQQFRTEIATHMEQLKVLRVSLNQQFTATAVNSESDDEYEDWAPERSPVQGLQGVSLPLETAAKKLKF